jgi:hypothetical protein
MFYTKRINKIQGIYNMPKLISFDIGIRNLAYCIFDLSTNISILDWNVLDISLESKENPEPIIEKKTCNYILTSKKEKGKLCSKKAKYIFEKDPENSLCYCEKHAKISEYSLPLKEFERTQIKKMSVNSLDDFIVKWKIPIDLGEKKIFLKCEKVEMILQWIQNHVLHKIGVEFKKKGALDFIQIGRNMADHLSKIDLEDIHYVIIENQISPIANKMRTIQGMVAQMFILQKVPVIEFVSSSNKLREYLGISKKEKTGEKKENGEKKEKGVNPEYKQHKKDGINYTIQWLESEKAGFSNWKTFFDTYPKKQDDLADAFLQGIWYLRKKRGISLEK